MFERCRMPLASSNWNELVLRSHGEAHNSGNFQAEALTSGKSEN